MLQHSHNTFRELDRGLVSLFSIFFKKIKNANSLKKKEKSGDLQRGVLPLSILFLVVHMKKKKENSGDRQRVRRGGGVWKLQQEVQQQQQQLEQQELSPQSFGR